MYELYLEVFSNISEGGVCLAPLETVISLFTYKCCDDPVLVLTFVITAKHESRAGFNIKIPKLLFEVIDEKDVDGFASSCKLPALVSEDGYTAVAGLCGVLRQIIKLVNPKHLLLGFKQSCLYACAESSLWTKFCEIDMVNTVNVLCKKDNWKCNRVDIPEDVARFEVHMSQPVKIHNIQKEKQDLARSEGFKKHGLPDSRLAMVQELDHKYSEGHRMTLADVILFPSFHIVFENLGSVYLKQHLPLSHEWYENMKKDEKIKGALKIFVGVKRKFDKEIYVNYVVPAVGSQSLYKGEVKKNQPKRHFYTRQEEILECLDKASEIENSIRMRDTTFGREIDFDWTTVPTEDNQIPAKRLERKGQQLENMTKAVLKIAKNGDQIVDFCSGSGHLGLILAHALPRCHIILLENKEQSLNRAKEQAARLKLSNIFFCQSNVDYFKGEFNIGVSLHACGVATDLVMERCLQQNAAFVCCPCCYGSIQPNHMISYPRSKAFRNSRLTLKEYLILGHASDQTHYEDNAKTTQGNQCMAIIDSDRCLRAKEVNYSVVLSKLDPPSCTPKNNLLVGVPQGRESDTRFELSRRSNEESFAHMLQPHQKKQFV